MHKLKSKVNEKAHEKWTQLEDKSHELLQKWEAKSREMIGGFLRIFGKDSTLVIFIWTNTTHDSPFYKVYLFSLNFSRLAKIESRMPWVA